METYKMYVDGGGGVTKNGGVSTYFSYKAFKNNKALPEVTMERWVIGNLIINKSIKSIPVIVDGKTEGYHTPNSDLFLPKKASIFDKKGRETNNIAEYAALYYGLKRFISVKGFTPLTVFQDSKLVVNQTLGVWQSSDKAKHLVPWKLGVQGLIKGWSNFNLEWIKRDGIVEILGH